MSIRWFLIPLLSAALTGCQTYQPSPPELERHYAAWLNSVPTNDTLASFAARIAATADTPAAWTLDDGLNLAEAEALALFGNAELRVARSRAGVTAASAAHAGLWDDPVLAMDVTRIVSGMANPWMFMTSISFTLPVSGRLKTEIALADAGHAVELHRIAEREWETRMMVRETWVERAAMEHQVETARAYQAELDALIAIVDRIEQAGEMTRTAARLFHIERMKLVNDLNAMEESLTLATLRLRQLMGLAPHVTLSPARDLPKPPAPESLPMDATRSLIEHPTLQTLKAMHEAAERTLAHEIRRQYPDLGVGPGYEYEDEEHRARVGLMLPLPIFNRNQRAIAEARAERDAARVMLETAMETLASDRAQAIARLHGAAERRRVMEERILPLIDAQFDDARRIAELGEVDTFMLLETLRQRLEGRLGLIDLIAAEARAGVALSRLLGPSNTDDNSAPPSTTEGGASW